MKSICLLFILSVIFATVLAGPPGRRAGLLDTVKDAAKGASSVLGAVAKGASAIIAPALPKSKTRKLDWLSGMTAFAKLANGAIKTTNANNKVEAAARAKVEAGRNHGRRLSLLE